MKNYRRKTTAAVLVLLICVATGAWKCGGTSEPKTVAEALTRLGNIKRNLKAAGEITAQQDLEISARLATANRAYRRFVSDEQERIASGTSDPNAKARALSELRSILSGIQNPAQLGINTEKSQALWNASIATLNTILAGMGG